MALRVSEWKSDSRILSPVSWSTGLEGAPLFALVLHRPTGQLQVPLTPVTAPEPGPRLARPPSADLWSDTEQTCADECTKSVAKTQTHQRR